MAAIAPPQVSPNARRTPESASERAFPRGKAELPRPLPPPASRPAPRTRLQPTDIRRCRVTRARAATAHIYTLDLHFLLLACQLGTLPELFIYLFYYYFFFLFTVAGSGMHSKSVSDQSVCHAPSQQRREQPLPPPPRGVRHRRQPQCTRLAGAGVGVAAVVRRRR